MCQTFMTDSADKLRILVGSFWPLFKFTWDNHRSVLSHQLGLHGVSYGGSNAPALFLLCLSCGILEHNEDIDPIPLQMDQGIRDNIFQGEEIASLQGALVFLLNDVKAHSENGSSPMSLDNVLLPQAMEECLVSAVKHGDISGFFEPTALYVQRSKDLNPRENAVMRLCAFWVMLMANNEDSNESYAPGRRRGGGGDGGAPGDGGAGGAPGDGGAGGAPGDGGAGGAQRAGVVAVITEVAMTLLDYYLYATDVVMVMIFMIFVARRDDRGRFQPRPRHVRNNTGFNISLWLFRLASISLIVMTTRNYMVQRRRLQQQNLLLRQSNQLLTDAMLALQDDDRMDEDDEDDPNAAYNPSHVRDEDIFKMLTFT
jgi:hypothetical protein